MKRFFLIGISIFLFCISPSLTLAASSPMLSPYYEKSYDDTGDRLEGVVPALGDNIVTRPWELTRWTGIVNYPNKSSSTINNYDVFNVKRAEGDSNFDRENGFGLVYKSPEALGDLFDAFLKGQTSEINAKQLKYYRDTFSDNANDESFKSGNNFYYKINWTGTFLRTAGIIQRMGYKFDQTKKVSETERQAIYTASKWPELKVIQSNSSFTINYSAYGFSDRKVRVVAIAKGSFPNMKRIVSLNDGKLIAASKETETGTIKVSDFDSLRTEFGDEIDVVLEDGYGRTAIQTVKLPTITNMDYVPTELSLTEGNQLWVKFKYSGDEFKTADYVNTRGIPMVAKVTITGPSGDTQTLQGMYDESPQTTRDGQTYAFYMGKVSVGKKPGTYKIKAVATINNPNHTDRALENPADAYENNSITDEWTRSYSDLVAQSITASPDSIKEGDSSSITAKIKNIGSVTYSNVLVRFYADDEIIYEAKKTMPANEVITAGPFNWSSDDIGNHNITVKVDPQQNIEEVDRSNNMASTGCEVVYTRNSTVTCSGSSDSKKWNVVYPTIVGFDDDGNAIWHYNRVQYSENLSMTSSVNTKQGITTNPDYPKASDVESRGSWEIIPYAKQQGKDPNTITRAGYGFEVNVTTKYQTDWEKKVPRGLNGTAKAIGGTYYGPDEVKATIYDTTGKMVKEINLEKVSGDRNSASWSLPKTTQTSNGVTNTDRKYYVNVNSPDGKYTVKLTTSRAGRSGFIVCSTETVQIYGSMYDDKMNLRSY